MIILHSTNRFIPTKPTFESNSKLMLVITLCFVLCLHGKNAIEASPADDPDIYRNVSELITHNGYPVEDHRVQTADGYLLSLQRMPPGKKKNLDGGGNKVVLLIHGIMADASIWVINSPQLSLGYVLFDAGYDVWLLSTRGCVYSKKHVKYKTEDYQFWDFSFDEVAHYDAPATIDYVLNYTGKKGLYVIGHSQGTTSVFAMLSDMPDYNDKVKLFIALAPVAFCGSATSFLKDLIPFADGIEFIVNMVSHGEISPDKFLPNKYKDTILRIGSKALLYAIIGPDSSQMNQSRMDVYIAHCLSGTSVKSLIHYAQMFNSKKFRKFDYGRDGNIERYNQKEPPDYDLCRITTPVALFWSPQDSLAAAEDVELLRKQLQNVVCNHRIPYPYNHGDFLLALNAPEFINEPILTLLSKF